MNTTYRVWRAGFVRRWHTNFDLCDTVDYDAGHQGRVVILILSFFPDASRALLVRASTHDQGEVAVGDVASPAKSENPEFRKFLHDLEGKEILRQLLPQPELAPEEQMVLSLCDWLDAWLWMMRHKPHLALREDWMKQLLDADAWANSLGIQVSFRLLIRAVSEGVYVAAWGE